MFEHLRDRRRPLHPRVPGVEDRVEPRAPARRLNPTLLIRWGPLCIRIETPTKVRGGRSRLTRLLRMARAAVDEQADQRDLRKAVKVNAGSDVSRTSSKTAVKGQ